MGSIINNSCLTIPPLAATISTLFQHGTVWFDSHKNQQMPIARLIHRLRYHMQEIIYGGRYLGSFGSHGSVAMSVNPDNVHRPIFDRISGVLKISTEVNTMSQNNSAQISEQNQPKTIADLHQAFADLCYSYGMLHRNISAECNDAALSDIIDDCKALSSVAGQVAGGAR